MRTTLRLGFILMILVYGCSKAPVPTDSEIVTGAELATLNIMTVDPQGVGVGGAEVFLDGQAVGETPMVIDSIAYGTHALRIQKNGFSIYNESIALQNNLPVTREVTLRKLPLNTGQLVLTVNEDSTLITVKNSHNEIVDEDVSKELAVVLEAGSYFINCQKSGYGLIYKAITVYADSITVENVILQKIENQAQPQIVMVAPDTGMVGQPVIIAWESSNTERVDIDYIESPGLNGKREVVFKTIGEHIIRAFAYNSESTVSISDTIMIQPAPTNAPTIQLALTPQTVYANEPVTIEWATANATSVDVDFVPDAGLRGQWQHIFAEPGEYIVNAMAYGPGGQAHAVDTVQVVSHDVLMPSITLNVSPNNVLINQPVIIEWSSNNANEVHVDFVPNPGLEGQWQTSFGSAGEFIIKAYAYGDGGQVMAMDTVYVNKPSATDPTVWLTVNPDTAYVNQEVTITWGAENATIVNVDFVPNAGLTGQWKTSFANPGTYVLMATAYNSNVSVQASDTVVVIEMGAPTLTLTAEADQVAFGEPVVIHWESNGNKVVIDQGVGTRGPSGSESIEFANPGVKTITAVAYGANNAKTTKYVTVTVLAPEQPELPVISLSVQDSIQVGKAVQIEWHSVNANDVGVDFVTNSGLSGKSEVVFQSSGQKIITATAYNDAGQVTVADTLIVTELPVTEAIVPIIVPSGAMVCAYHHIYGQVDDNAGTLTIENAGYYRMTASIFYNSGDDQKNESCFITIDNQGPGDPNADKYKVMPDDPGTPHTAYRDAGLFYLTEGNHTIELHHYVTIANQYPQFVINGPITGAESTEVLFFQAEFVRH
ncbi:PEGA domain-containing protein [candidate division KSB1 bacterium]|nr:PEGA domain-containing protein [candidate division KSB1 bacterium]